MDLSRELIYLILMQADVEIHAVTIHSQGTRFTAKKAKLVVQTEPMAKNVQGNADLMMTKVIHIILYEYTKLIKFNVI